MNANAPDCFCKIKLDSLSVGYGGKALISDITLSLGKGEITTLIGPNGSGKSTILKTITRRLAAVAGTVYLDEKNLRTLSGKDVATQLAVVLTERVNPELMTCFEFVSAGRYPYTGSFGMLTEHDKSVVKSALRKVGAQDIADCDVSKISDGQRQRILLARAICQEPEVIVLDEPTSFLDIRHKIELLEILSDMAKNQDICVVMSLHEIDLAQRISDKILCVKGEKIAAYGTPDEIFSGDTIRTLYGLENGSFHTLLGSVELAAPQGEIRCFVVGGNGCGIPYYRALQKMKVPFAAGILPENDIDMAVCKPLAQKTVCSAPYSAAAEAQSDEAAKLIDACAFVIDCGCPVGETNRANQALLAYAAQQGKPVIKSLRALAEVKL